MYSRSVYVLVASVCRTAGSGLDLCTQLEDTQLEDTQLEDTQYEEMKRMPAAQHVLVLGGGYVGLYVARGLLSDRTGPPVKVTVVDRSPYMTYQPLLPEVAGGHVAPRDVTIPLRRTLRKARVIRGTVEHVDVDRKNATVTTIAGASVDLDYDHIVFALGAVTRVFPTPGLAENAVGFKSLEEAVYTRNRVLENIALAATTTDPAERAKCLTFVFIGAGYTGVEALSELQKLSLTAIQDHPSLDPSELRWVLIEALDRVAPEVGPELSAWSLRELRSRGIDVRLKTTMKSCVDGEVELSTGERMPSNTIVWTAGVQPNPVLDHTNVPRGPKGHVNADPSLRVVRDDGSIVDGAWAAGDNAQVPDLTKEKQPAYYPPNAQNALRQAVLLGKNIRSAMGGLPLTEYRHSSLGTIASYGIGDGAALILGVKLRGLPAWLAHRMYHGLVIPTVNRKVRVFAGWITNAVSPPALTSLAALERPRQPFAEAVDMEKKGTK